MMMMMMMILIYIFSFTQPLSARRNEHERCRKQIKEMWHRELKRMQESVGSLRKAKSLYVQRQQEWERAKEAAQRAENAAESSTEQASKLDKRKKTEEDALQKVRTFPPNNKKKTKKTKKFTFFRGFRVTRGLEFCLFFFFGVVVLFPSRRSFHGPFGKKKKKKIVRRA